jgi:hypothetical protein
VASLLIGAIVVLFVVKFYWFIKHKRYTLTEFSQAMFLRLFFTLFIVFIGFSLIYYGLFLNGHVVDLDTVNNHTISHFSEDIPEDYDSQSLTDEPIDFQLIILNKEKDPVHIIDDIYHYLGYDPDLSQTINK